MKGMVFTEFLDLVEERFGLDVADTVIDAADSEHAGAYTAVGDYDHHEMVRMVVQLSEQSGAPVADLLAVFGEHLFSVFAERYGQFFEGAHDSFAFLASIENTIHVEVRKLYPTAELPSFSYPEVGAQRMVMDYRSTRPLAHFALGLIRGCAAHFGDAVEIEHVDLSDGAHTSARFVLTRGH